MKRTLFFFALALLIFLRFTLSLSTTTSFWKVELKDDFEQGKPEGISISGRGELSLAPKIELLAETGEAYVWALARDTQGNIYAGTGDGGKIFKIDKNGKLSLYFDSPELEILSLALAPKGNLYAGTSADGLIYRLTPLGKASTFFKTEESYVWSLAVDNQGNIYAGTGAEGRIYRIDPQGRGGLFYETGEKHVMSLLWTKEGLLATSQGEGLVYRITSQGKGFVLYDPPQGEVRSLVKDERGNVYLGALGDQALDQGGNKVENGERGAVFRVSQDGGVSKLCGFPEKPIYSILLRENGDLLLGSEGELLSLDSLGGVGNMAQLEGFRILCLLKGDKGEAFLGTADGGRIYKIFPGFLKEGRYDSQVFDAQTISHWGRINFRDFTPDWTKLTIKTRSGNTQRPDSTWSNWSPQYRKGERIKSPSARFIQFRVILSTRESRRSPALSQVTISYLPRNLRPKVSSLKVYPPGEGLELLPSSLLVQPTSSGFGGEVPPPEGKGGWIPQGVRVVEWEAEDSNKDQLSFSIYTKGWEEEDWKPLKRGVKGRIFSWDSRCFPDGTYLLKVVATDSSSNPPGMALWGERISRPFLVDNTPPEVKITSVASIGEGRYRVEGMVKDNTSLVKEISFSLDGGGWIVISPLDRILDSPKEEFSFPLDPLAKGEHTMVVKATDFSLNIGTGKKVIRVR